MNRWTPLGRPDAGALLALYAEVDELLAGWTCACSRSGVGETPEAQCCHFGVTGREPYPTAVELEEVRHAMRAAGVTPRRPAQAAHGRAAACPLLSPEGRCRIYASRPFGCRTFFCEHAEAPYGARAKLPRDAINAHRAAHRGPVGALRPARPAAAAARAGAR